MHSWPLTLLCFFIPFEPFSRIVLLGLWSSLFKTSPRMIRLIAWCYDNKTELTIDGNSLIGEKDYSNTPRESQWTLSPRRTCSHFSALIPTLGIPDTNQNGNQNGYIVTICQSTNWRSSMSLSRGTTCTSRWLWKMDYLGSLWLDVNEPRNVLILWYCCLIDKEDGKPWKPWNSCTWCFRITKGRLQFTDFGMESLWAYETGQTDRRYFLPDWWSWPFLEMRSTIWVWSQLFHHLKGWG